METSKITDRIINSSMSLMVPNSQRSYHRNNGDFFNNFWVNITARSFTNIEQIWEQNAANQEAIIERQVMKELAPLEATWVSKITDASDHSFKAIEGQFNRHISELLDREEEDQFSMHQSTVKRFKTNMNTQKLSNENE